VQRKRAHDLLQVAARYPSFPIVLEAYRECLRDVFDLPGLVDIARRVRRREIRLVTVDTQAPSPFSASLLFGYVANYLYEGDAPLAERRAQALAVDQAQLRELLGEAELRELVDRRALAELETALQCSTRRARPRAPSGSTTSSSASATSRGTRSRPASGRRPTATPRRLPLPGSPSSSASGGRSAFRGRRGALGRGRGRGRLATRSASPPRPASPPPFSNGSPTRSASSWPAMRAPMARSPRRTSAVATRRGGPPSRRPRRAPGGRPRPRGEFRPGGHGREWCSSDVLGTLRRRSLAALRKEVEPAEPEALARFLLDWQGVALSSSTRRGPDALLDVVEQLQGAALPASTLEKDVLPARIPATRRKTSTPCARRARLVWSASARSATATAACPLPR